MPKGRKGQAPIYTPTGDPMSDPSNFSDKEIEQQRREATSRKKNIDQQRVQLMRDTMQIIQTGTLEQLEENTRIAWDGTGYAKKTRNPAKIYFSARRLSAVA